MAETIISPLPTETNEQIKRIVSYHYKFEPRDEDIEIIDMSLRNNYLASHDQQIIRELAAADVSRSLLTYKDRLGMLC